MLDHQKWRFNLLQYLKRNALDTEITFTPKSELDGTGSLVISLAGRAIPGTLELALDPANPDELRWYGVGARAFFGLHYIEQFSLTDADLEANTTAARQMVADLCGDHSLFLSTGS